MNDGEMYKSDKNLKAIYFSPTGTTKKIIESIIKGISPKTVEYIDLTKRDTIYQKENVCVDEEDLIILGAPVYGGFLYKDFRDYIKCIDFNNKPVAIALLYGNATVLFAKREIISTVKERNGKVIGYGDFIGEHSFSTTKIPVAINRPNMDDINTALSFGKILGDKLDKGDIAKSNRHINLIDKFINKIADKKPLHTGKMFFFVPQTDLELCDRCGVCIKRCPKSCINNDIQTDEDECIVCMACVKVCHNHARITKAKNPLIKYGLKLINRRKKESKYEIGTY